MASPPQTIIQTLSTIAPETDTLPVIYALLSRLQSPSSSTSTSGSPPAATPSQITSGTGPLTTKDIPIASDEIKHKLQKARTQVKELPDMHRSLAEQEEEIRELEDKVRKQREVLQGLRDVGAAVRGERELRRG